MTNDNATRPAFPGYSLREGFSGKIYDHHLGLSKREYFAGIALQGMLTQADNFTTVEQLVIAAVDYADTLLYRLSETNKVT